MSMCTKCGQIIVYGAGGCGCRNTDIMESIRQAKASMKAPTDPPKAGGALSEEELVEVRRRVSDSVGTQNPESVWAKMPRLLATIDQLRAEVEGERMLRDSDVQRFLDDREQLLARAEKSQKRVAWLESGDTHTCHDECEQPLCKATRDLSTALVRVAELEKTLASVPRPLGMACTACGTKEPIRATSWKCQCGQEYYDMEMAQRLSTPPSAAQSVDLSGVLIRELPWIKESIAEILRHLPERSDDPEADRFLRCIVRDVNRWASLLEIERALGTRIKSISEKSDLQEEV